MVNGKQYCMKYQPWKVSSYLYGEGDGEFGDERYDPSMGMMVGDESIDLLQVMQQAEVLKFPLFTCD